MDVMWRILTDPQSRCYAHAINVYEAYRDCLARGTVAEADQAITELIHAGIIVREDFDEALWKDAAQRKAAHRVSTADSIGIALANRLSADFVSTDHHELDAVNASGAYVITFIR